MLRHVEQRLFLIIEVAGHDQRARAGGCPGGARRIRMFPATASVAEVRITVSSLSKQLLFQHATKHRWAWLAGNMPRPRRSIQIHVERSSSLASKIPGAAAIPGRGGTAGSLRRARFFTRFRCEPISSSARSKIVVAPPRCLLEEAPRALETRRVLRLRRKAEELLCADRPDVSECDPARPSRTSWRARRPRCRARSS